MAIWLHVLTGRLDARHWCMTMSCSANGTSDIMEHVQITADATIETMMKKQCLPSPEYKSKVSVMVNTDTNPASMEVFMIWMITTLEPCFGVPP